MTLKLLIVLLIMVFIVHPIFTSSIPMVLDSSLSIEEDLKLERQLKVLNKPPIKTFHTKEGEIIDCIDINKQPALDHPLLKKHKIQTKPTKIPKGLQKISSSGNVNLLPQRGTCPTGTVPIRRTSKKDLLRMRSLPKRPYVSFGQQSNSFSHVVQVRMEEGPNFYGVLGYVSVYNVSVSYQQFSSANLWIQNGPADQPDQLNGILAGWAVSPDMNGDNLTRLFTYWFGDNSTGCYGTRCPGFVSTNPQIEPDAKLWPVSTYGGQQYVVELIVYQDSKTGNWWFGIDSKTFIGYWPKELLPKLRNGGNYVAWGGIAIADKQGNSPPMGSGHMPNNDYKRSSFFRSIKVMNDLSQFVTPDDDTTIQHVDKSGCYGIVDKRDCGHKELHYCFTFGGIGGQCG